MSQLALNLPTRLSCTPGNFLAHSGVLPALKIIEAALVSERFFGAVICAPSRSGRSHLAIKIADLTCRARRHPILLSGADLLSWIAARPAENLISGEEVLIIDDLQYYLREAAPGSSGPFVMLCERARVVGAALIFLMDLGVSDLPCDEHIMSRIRSFQQLGIDQPDDSELPQLIEMMALQRGLKIKPNNVRYLSQHVRRSIADLERYFERVASLAVLRGDRIRRNLLRDAV